MPHWSPGPIWHQEDAYIIGGGASLSSFDWSLLRGKHTIGCNSAYSLGEAICEITIFGDLQWWERIGKKGMEKIGYKGLVVGCSPRLHNDNTPWLLRMERNKTKWLGTDSLLWVGNTGGLAINLALILGAKRVFLLGFDMTLLPRKDPTTGKEEDPKPRANWHDLRYEPEKKQVYKRFVNEMRHIPKSLKKDYPDREIINVSDGSSKLDLFPTISMEECFRKVAV